MRPMDYGGGGGGVAMPVPGAYNPQTILDFIKAILLGGAAFGGAALAPSRYEQSMEPPLAKRYPDIFGPDEAIPEMSLLNPNAIYTGGPEEPPQGPPQYPPWVGRAAKIAAGVGAGGILADTIAQPIIAMRGAQQEQRARETFPQELADRRQMALQQAFYDMKRGRR